MARSTRASTKRQTLTKRSNAGQSGISLRHPSQSVGEPWPVESLRAYDLPGVMGWGRMLLDILRSRGWSVSSPCRTERDCVFVKEFEAMLRRTPPSRLFGQRGVIEEGKRLRTLRLQPYALWMQSFCKYRVPGSKRVIFHEDFARLVAKYGRDLPGGKFRIVGIPGTETALAKDRFSEYFRGAPWYPEAFVLPRERLALLRRFRENPGEYWIGKPRNESCGAGICVWSANDASLASHVRGSQGRSQCVLQRYVANPLLLGGYKFHLRIHLMITSLSPPEAFVQAGGQCLCSTKPYSLSKSGLGDFFDPPVHITNTGLNMKPEQRDSFLAKKAVIGRGQQISMRQLERHLAESRPCFDRKMLWAQIMQIAKEVVLYLAQAPSIVQHGKFLPGQFFDMLGMDLVVDRKLKVWMCETNDSPGLDDQDEKVFGVQNPDYKKESLALSQVWHDSLALLGMDGGRVQARGSLRGWYQVEFSSCKS